MSVTSVSSSPNLYYQLQQALQVQNQVVTTQSQSSGAAAIGVAAIVALSGAAASSAVAQTGASAQSGSSTSGASSTSQCPQGRTSCIECGQCGKSTTASAAGQNSIDSLLAASNSINTSANYQMLQAVNAYEKSGIYGY